MIPSSMLAALNRCQNSREVLEALGDLFESLEVRALHESFDESTIRTELVSKAHRLLYGVDTPREIYP